LYWRNLWQEKPEIVIIGFALALRAFAAAVIPLGYDEAYYGLYSQNLAWGYFDHPPFVALSAGLGIWLSGLYEPFFLRLGALLLFIPSSYLIFSITARLFNRSAALFSLLLFSLTPYFLFGLGAFVIPDNTLGLFWLLFLYALVRLRQSDDKRWFLIAGASAGLALMAKYHAIFLPAGLLLLLVFSRQWHSYWRSIWLYGGLVIMTALFLPNLFWNAENQWITIVTQFGKGSAAGFNLSFSSFLQGLAVQAGYLLPWTMVFLIFVQLLTWREGRSEDIWLLAFTVPTILAFTLIGASRPILPHWPMPGYLATFVLAGKVLSEMSWRPRRTLHFASAITLSIALILLVLQTATGILPLPKKGDITLDGQGWHEAVTSAEKRYALSVDRDFILVHKWFLGGQAGFASANRYAIAMVNYDAPHAFAWWHNPVSLLGKNAIAITSERYPDFPVEQLRKSFASVSSDTLTSYRPNNAPAQRFYLWYCRDYRGGLTYRYGPFKKHQEVK
jgi:4-amino-4-deoxy-L-arabinose transferase-like glycosyltransferase